MAEDAPVFWGPEDIRRWLNGRPRDDSVVITARAALRAVPALVSLAATKDQRRASALILPVFRAMAAPWAVAHCPAQGAELRAAASAAAASASAAALAGGVGAEVLAGAPLWPEGRPGPLARAWRDLKAWLHARDGERWQVWTDWYDARLRGDPANCRLEVARVTKLTEEDWADPARANARLAEIEARFASDGAPGDGDATDLLQQQPAAHRFVGTADGLGARPQVGDGPNADELAALLPALTAAAERYLEKLTEHQQLDLEVRATAQTIHDSLNAWATDPQPGVLWMDWLALDGQVHEYSGIEGRAELPRGVLASMATLSRALKGFLALYPLTHKMDAAALALGLDADRVEAVERILVALEAVARAAPEVLDTAVAALADGRAAVDHDTDVIARNGDRVKRAEAIERRRQTTAQRVLVGENFINGAVSFS